MTDKTNNVTPAEENKTKEAESKNGPPGEGNKKEVANTILTTEPAGSATDPISPNATPNEKNRVRGGSRGNRRTKRKSRRTKGGSRKKTRKSRK